MADFDTSKPLFESSVKLCAAIKKQKCLYDQKSCQKDASPECKEAWKLVAKEIDETVPFCKNRWRTLRKCFFEGLKRRGNKYYLHDYLKFLVEPQENNSIGNFGTNLNNLKDSTTTGSLQENYKESEMTLNNTYFDEDTKSVCSETTSTDASVEYIQQNNANEVFVINEIEEESFETDFLDEGRSNYNRSCKRPLDPEIIEELAEEEPEEKRSRKIDKSDLIQERIKPIKVRVDRLKINLSEKKVESVGGKMSDRSTNTDLKQTRDCGIQYEFNSSDFDDVFWGSIKNQLHKMNARQKMNFKSKIYRSLLDVFDDATDFPNSSETLQLPLNKTSSIVNTTIGELRLMRELATLVQAAKSTPEIMNAKDRVKISTAIQSKTPVKVPLPIVDNRPKKQSSPLSIRASIDDDDFQFFIDNLDDDDDLPLPRSLDEIKAKSTEPTKVASDDIGGLPRRVLQKVVRVSGPSGSTIVTREGDRKRIYRIVPKQTNSNGSYIPPSKNNNSTTNFAVPASKNTQETKKDSAVGTFYVSPKNSQDTAKVNSSSSIVGMRPLNNKPTSSSSKSVNCSSQATNNASSNNSICGGQTMFKNVHPANRILSSTTGYFKMVPTTKSVTSTYMQKASNVISTTSATNTISSQAMNPKLPVRPMMAPIMTKKISAVRPAPATMQRRYSICGPLPAEKSNTSVQSSPSTTSDSISSTSNGDSQVKSDISQIQISDPVSLNAKALSQISSCDQDATAPENNSKMLTESSAPSKDSKPRNILPETPQGTLASRTSSPTVNDTNITIKSNQQKQIHILETAGTVAADDLDPLYVKMPQIKSEPIDD